MPAAPAQLLQILVESPELDAFLDAAVRLAVDTVPRADSCGLTMRRDGKAFTVATSDAFAAQVDEVQYGAGQGPCLTSLATGTIVQVDDMTAESRWGRFRTHAVAHGLASSLSLPLSVDGQTVAAMNLYARTTAAFGESERQHGGLLADQTAAALKLALRHGDLMRTREQLDEAMRSRSIIDQALGVMMAQQRCTAAQAFDVLRQVSQNRNRRLRDVAADIITQITRQPPEQPPPFRT